MDNRHRDRKTHTDRQADRQADRYITRQTNRYRGGRTYTHTQSLHIETDIRTDGHTHLHTDEQIHHTNTWTDSRCIYG